MALVWWTVVVLAPDVVRAEAPADEEAAKALFTAGVELVRQGDWEEALSRFEASLALVERPSTVYNVGSALTHLSRYVEAAASFERYLELTTRDPKASLRSSAKRKLVDARAAIAVVTLELEPPDAEVSVDGKARADSGSPRMIQLDPGEHVIDAKAGGYRSGRLVIPIAHGERTTERLVLAQMPPPAVVRVEPPAPAPLEPPPAKPVVGTSDEGSWLESPVFWTITGIVIAGAVTGAVLLSRGEEDPYGGTTGDVIQGLRNGP